ncbi:ribonuclease Z, mitochondrial [Paramuricea clavata]|uniref:ribonuclease Z n=1 Tax=Paramuricea clavata TaxID=317549 RepID=A0A7D9EK09_PARCT|nr:ribonuclease Z, mitochondrial [Paramuricea clavata]
MYHIIAQKCTPRQKTAPSNGRPLIHFRYVFSCGEATQRLFHEQKLKLGKINNLFLTQLTWQCIGGLPGLLLTLREACKQSLSIHGPPGLSDFLTASQCFMSMHNVDLKCSEYDGESDGVYKDENIIVKPIPIKGQTKDNFSYNSKITEIFDDEGGTSYDIDYSQPKSNIDKNRGKSKSEHCVNTKSPKRFKLDVEPRTVVNYICELVAVPGKMNVKKAFELGVPSGPLLGKLQKGKDVTLENGAVVRM